MTEKDKTWLELHKKLDELEGNKIINLMQGLFTTYYMRDKNYEELVNLINFYEQDISIWHIQNRAKLYNLEKEFSRLLHNYLSSVYTLSEHTTNFCRALNNEKLTEEYKIKSKELAKTEQISFLLCLRNYTQHFKLPIVGASIQMNNIKNGQGECTQKLFLDKERLLSHDFWRQESKVFLEKQESKIDIKPVLIECQRFIISFHKWFDEKVRELHFAQIEEYKELVDAIIKLETEMK